MQAGAHKKPETTRCESLNIPSIAANSSSRSSDVLFVLNSRRSGVVQAFPNDRKPFKKHDSNFKEIEDQSIKVLYCAGLKA